MNTDGPNELAQLRELFSSEDPVPARVLDAAYAAPARTRHAGSRPMELVDDSAESERDEQLRLLFRPTRALTFSWPEHVLELELTRISTDVFAASGVVMGPSVDGDTPPCVIDLHHRGGARSSPVDAHGGFRFDTVPSGPVSVVFRTAHEPSVVADWLVW